MIKKIHFLSLLLLPLFANAQHPLLADWLRMQSARLSLFHSPAPDLTDKARSGASPLAKLNEVVYLLSNSRADTFDVAATQWLPTDSTVYLYNSDTLLDTKQQLQFDEEEAAWISYLATFYTYDAQKNNTVQLIQQWNDEFKYWYNLTRLLGAYDAQKNLIGMVIQNWNGSDWDSATHFLYQYDANNNLTQTTILNRNFSTGTWDSTQRFVFVYDGLGNLIADTTYTWIGTGFGYTNLVTYQYNGLNQNDVRIGQIYSNNKWKNSWSDTLSYDANNNLIMLVRWGWSQSVKKFSLSEAKIVYEYNASNQLVHRINYNGDGASAFLPASEYLYTYSMEGNLEEYLLKVYDNTAAAFKNFQREVYFYSNLVSHSPALSPNHLSISAYPNPANQWLNLEISSPVPQSADCYITDRSGRMLQHQRLKLQPGTETYPLPLERLPAGAYLLHITTEKGFRYPTVGFIAP